MVAAMDEEWERQQGIPSHGPVSNEFRPVWRDPGKAPGDVISGAGFPTGPVAGPGCRCLGVTSAPVLSSALPRRSRLPLCLLAQQHGD
jgi:hypothetical protein